MASAGSAMSATRLRDGKTEALAGIIQKWVGRPIRRVLVVGCGSGLEAAILAQELNAEVVGIDLDSSFDSAVSTMVDLRRGDATCMEFADGVFDFVYSYHALEHIPDYRKALAEMKRVLSDGGSYCIGTPNRSRLVGYLGSKTATLAQKISWNLIDWKARVRGKFRNEFGAHAGYTSEELRSELEGVFGQVDEITFAYYREVYKHHAGKVGFLEKAGLGKLLFPAVYFIGKK